MDLYWYAELSKTWPLGPPTVAPESWLQFSLRLTHELRLTILTKQSSVRTRAGSVAHTIEAAENRFDFWVLNSFT